MLVQSSSRARMSAGRVFNGRDEALASPALRLAEHVRQSPRLDRLQTDRRTQRNEAAAETCARVRPIEILEATYWLS